MTRTAIILLLITGLVASGGGQPGHARSRTASAAAQSDRPFRLARHQAPDEPPATPFERLHCAEAGKGLRVCKHVTSSETFFTVEKDGAALGKWPTSTYNGGTSRFDVLAGDLDGDGEDELIVANCDGVTNGIGFQYWTISILPDPEKRGFKPPLEFRVEEYGAEGTFVKHPGDAACNILATEWQWDAIKEKRRRGVGLYFVGRWFRYNAGRLEPIAARPVLARRYLFGFERERWDSYEDSKKPLTWLKSRSATATASDPLKRLDESSSVRGRVLSVTRERREQSEADTIKLVVRLASGRVVAYRYSDEASEDEAGTFGRFGQARSGVLYPKAYRPASPERWLGGRRVRIATYKDDYGAPQRVIWTD